MDSSPIVIRTSDRALFKRCRRKWGWHSSLRQNLTSVNQPSYFWLGTGGHFALEDYHGHNRYGHPVEAFHAYVDAWKIFARRSSYELPDDFKEQVELCEGLLENYLIWLRHRDPLRTYWLDGEPQVEVTAQIPLPTDPPSVYQVTIDRVVEIEGELWILDYKFYRQFSQTPLEFDQQMSAYIWAASTIYDRPIIGGILHEFKKTLPKPPRILSNGTISTAQSQGTTYWLYRDALEDMYGTIARVPDGNIQCLNDLGAQESEDRDDFIKRSKTRRTHEQQEAEGTKVLLEAEDMLNPDLPMYPNPTRDCSWDCQLSDICLMMDRDDDWQQLLEELTIERNEENQSWRDHLKVA